MTKNMINMPKIYKKVEHITKNHSRPINAMTRLQACRQLLIRWQQCGTTSCIMSCREPGQRRLWLQDVFVGWAVITEGDNSALQQIAVEVNQHLFSFRESTSPAWQLASVSQFLLASQGWPEYTELLKKTCWILQFAACQRIFFTFPIMRCIITCKIQQHVE